jgi:hypothetical protein
MIRLSSIFDHGVILRVEFIEKNARPVLVGAVKPR